MTLLLQFITALGLVLLTSAVVAANEEPRTKNQEQGAAPFRPEAGKFPPLEKAHSYRGELVFVDHANRRGSLRLTSGGIFRTTAPHPFALLPYAVVRYHGAPADLRDIPLGTMLHVRAFLPPDPKTSAVPVLPVNNREKSPAGNLGTAPAENHVLLLEDEPSYCQRQGVVWKLKELEIKNREGTIIATREAPNDANTKPGNETLTFDASTRIWRGRECLRIEHIIADKTWPAEGKKALGGQTVHLSITWRPTPGGVFGRFHLSDIWLDDEAMQNTTQHQTELHKSFIRSRWMPAWVDAVEYGKFGRATVTATLFGGMDASLYADFKPGITALMNAAESTLKHTEGGTAGPTQMAARGKLIEVRGNPSLPQIQGSQQIAPGTKPDSEKKSAGLPEPSPRDRRSQSVGNQNTVNPPLGSSGIQIRFETDLITEGMRPKRIVKVRPNSWPDVHLPREEYLGNGASNIDERFPTPAIFPTY